MFVPEYCLGLLVSNALIFDVPSVQQLNSTTLSPLTQINTSGHCNQITCYNECVKKTRWMAAVRAG